MLKTEVTIVKLIQRRKQSICRPISEMLYLKQTYFGLFLVAIVGSQMAATVSLNQKTISKEILVQNIIKLLDKLEDSKNLTKNIKLGATLSEFLIKQKQRFYEPTRYEQQAYNTILHKLNHIIRRPDDAEFGNIYKRILDNIFQKNILLTTPVLKQGHIDTHFEYKSLVKDYEDVIDVGRPTRNESDECIAAFATMDSNCDMPATCVDIMVSDLPTYGYHRMHQILILYILMHHICAPTLGSQTAYDILASQKCTQAYREHNVIRALNIPIRHRDIFLEQDVICGLFGYVEFINWHNLANITSWPQVDGCLCYLNFGDVDCDCNNHINSLVLAYYVNALVMLN